MKPLPTFCIAVALSAGAALSLAQGYPSPVSRADVKAETRALANAHRLTPAGQAIAPNQAPSPTSPRTRAERKEETLAARRSGQLQPPGVSGAVKAERLAMSAPSTTTRTERKAQTVAARGAGTLIPAGEGPDAPKH